MTTPKKCVFCSVAWPHEVTPQCPRCGRAFPVAQPARGWRRLLPWGIALIVLASLGYPLMMAVENVRESTERMQ